MIIGKERIWLRAKSPREPPPVSRVEAREARFVGKASQSRRLEKNKDRQRCYAEQAAARRDGRVGGTGS